jgi:ribosome-associated protein
VTDPRPSPAPETETRPSPAPETETLPSPDGLPRRRKPLGRTATAAVETGERPDPITPEEEALADQLEAEVAAQEAAGRAAGPSEPEIGETLRERGARLTPLEVARLIVDAAEDKKAADIVLLDVSELTSMADYFVICSGGSERQLGAIADGITGKLRDEGVRPIGREGGSNSHWTLLDFGAVIVHVFAVPEREYYQIERYWAKAKTVVRVQ